MVNSAKESMEKDPRPLLIFPEGTRTAIGEKNLISMVLPLYMMA